MAKRGREEPGHPGTQPTQRLGAQKQQVGSGWKAQALNAPTELRPVFVSELLWHLRPVPSLQCLCLIWRLGQQSLGHPPQLGRALYFEFISSPEPLACRLGRGQHSPGQGRILIPAWQREVMGSPGRPHTMSALPHLEHLPFPLCPEVVPAPGGAQA